VQGIKKITNSIRLRRAKRTWNHLGSKDPFWFILPFPNKKHHQWNLEEFYNLGEAEINDELLTNINKLNITLKKEKVLDFGCGVGRLARAFGNIFKEYHGVDISASMINLAKKLNPFPERCFFHLNVSSDLRIFQNNTFDLIYSILVLQHIGPDITKSYIKEFLRILKPGGLLVFQLPTTPTRPVPCLPGQTYSINELDSSAFQKHISIKQSSLKLKTNEKFLLKVTVCNKSPVNWPSVGTRDGKYWIRIGNHWLNKKGEKIIQDDGRANLPYDLMPNDCVDIPLPITSPPHGGHYWVELDLVQDGVAWFNDKGSQTLKIPVLVLGDGYLRESFKYFSKRVVEFFKYLSKKVANFFYPYVVNFFYPYQYDMYGIPKDELTEIVTHFKGEIIAFEENDKAGERWFSNTYFITKSG
jgi:SAM-dependent methyltransferase